MSGDSIAISGVTGANINVKSSISTASDKEKLLVVKGGETLTTGDKIRIEYQDDETIIIVRSS